MDHRNWRFRTSIARYLLCSLALLLILIGAVPASGQRIAPREAFRRYAPNAVKELGRGLSPADQRKAYEGLSLSLATAGLHSPDSVADRMKLVSDGLKQVDLGFQLSDQSRKRQIDLKPIELLENNYLRDSKPLPTLSADIFRVLNSTVRREEIIESTKVKVVRELEGRNLVRGIKSELEDFLERDLKLKDFAAVADSFDANVIVKWVELQQETTLLRLFGGNSTAVGRYLFCCLEAPPAAPTSRQFVGSFAAWTDARGLATPPKNSLNDLAIIHLPARKKVLIGTVADNFADRSGQYRLGGNTQIFVPAVSDFPYERYRLDPTKTSPDDIIVVLDNGRVGRFRPPA